MTSSGPPAAEGGQAAATRAASRWLRRQARPARAPIALSIAAGFGVGLAGIAQAALIAFILHGALVDGAGVADLVLPFAALLAVIPVRAACAWAMEAAGAVSATRVKTRVRRALLDRIHALGPAWQADRQSGGTATVLVEQVEALDGFYARYLPQTVLAALVPLAILVAAFATDWVAGLILAVAGPMVPILMALIGLGAAGAARRQFRTLAWMGGYFLDRLQGLTTLRLFGRAEEEVDRIEQVADEYRRRTMGVLRIAFLSSASLEFFSTAALAVVAIYVGFALLGLIAWGPAGEITLFSGLFVLLLAPDFFLPLRQLAAHYHDRASAIGAAEAILATLDAPEPGVGGTRPLPEGGIDIVFDAVSVAFESGTRPALRTVSFHIAAGERVALVGASGAGKSTLLALLLGFRRPDAGRIRINGADLAELDVEALRRKTAWIGQAPVLFHGTLRDNIRLGRPDADDAVVDRAAALARVAEFAAALPRGLDTPIGERGVGLSGGQAQRVALARAFLKDAPLLLLDEPTAALDRETEAEILATLDRLAEGRTVIVATHSPLLIAGARRRLVLDAGRVEAEAA